MNTTPIKAIPHTSAQRIVNECHLPPFRADDAQTIITEELHNWMEAERQAKRRKRQRQSAARCRPRIVRPPRRHIHKSSTRPYGQLPWND